MESTLSPDAPAETIADLYRDREIERARYGRTLGNLLRDHGFVTPRGTIDFDKAARRISERTGQVIHRGQVYQIATGRVVPTLPTAERIARGIGFAPKLWFQS